MEAPRRGPIDVVVGALLRPGVTSLETRLVNIVFAFLFPRRVLARAKMLHTPIGKREAYFAVDLTTAHHERAEPAQELENKSQATIIARRGTRSIFESERRCVGIEA